MAGLTLRFERDDDGDVRLFAALQVGGFTGESQYWCPPSEFSFLIDELDQYPIPHERPIRGEWAGGVRLEIKPLDAAGLLEARTSVTDFWDTRNRCEAIFHCHYADLATFREGLLRAGPTGDGKAVLSSS
jgi:hypothetical protein